MKEPPCPNCGEELTYQEQEDIDGFPYIYELYFCDACDISIDPREMGEMYGQSLQEYRAD